MKKQMNLVCLLTIILFALFFNGALLWLLYASGGFLGLGIGVLLFVYWYFSWYKNFIQERKQVSFGRLLGDILIPTYALYFVSSPDSKTSMDPVYDGLSALAELFFLIIVIPILGVIQSFILFELGRFVLPASKNQEET